MALKQAKIFKDFHIIANADNTGVTFSMNAPLTVNVKNDNFAQQVEILNNADTTDLFNYKYITFDGSAIFEITDCIKNGKYTTLFVQYLSNIKFDEVDTNFRVDAVSVNTLQKLGIDINEFLQVLGTSTQLKTEQFGVLTDERQEPFLYAVKLRFSEFPQNINYCWGNLGTNPYEENDVAFLKNAISLSFNQDIGAESPTYDYTFTISDNAKVAFLFIPLHFRTRIVAGRQADYTMRDFLSALSALISDLVLSVEVTAMSGKSFYSNGSNSKFTVSPLTITKTDTEDIITLADDEITNLRFLIRWVAGTFGTSGNQYGCPVFLAVTNAETGSLTASMGFFECSNAFNLYLPISPTRNLQQLIILGNMISLSELRKDYIVVKRVVGGLRIYIDYERNIYADITTSLEFARNAYSNYEAYQKANIDLTQRQQFDMLKQQQEQARSLQTVDSAFAAVNGLMGAVGAGFVAGGPAGAIVGGLSSAIKSGASIAQSEIKFNMQQQNEKANAKLSAAQQHEKARATIVPSSDLKGSVSFATAFISLGTQNGRAALYTVRYLEFSAMQMAMLTKHIFDNVITDKVTDISQIKKPEWQTVQPFFQVRIVNRSAINNRKDFIVFMEE